VPFETWRVADGTRRLAVSVKSSLLCRGVQLPPVNGEERDAWGSEEKMVLALFDQLTRPSLLKTAEDYMWDGEEEWGDRVLVAGVVPSS
jgi:hypothetical protein